jgi:hypothetical protein
MRHSLLPALALAALAGCSDYVPPAANAGASPHYAGDLAACQTSGNEEAHRRVMSRFPLWASYPVSLPLEQRHRIADCMTGKGYSVNG